MDLPPMAGRTVLVTGTTSGVGRETARGLARLGARVVMAVRNVDAGQVLARALSQETGNPALEVRRLDLASLREVARFADEVRRDLDALHVLVNNAGLHTARREVTPDGYERTFATNHLGHFLLTTRLLDLLKASGRARIVTVASEAHRYGTMRFDDLMGERRWSGVRAYTQSKLANVLFARELARRLEDSGVTSNALHPGSVRSNWARGPESGLLRVAVALASPFLLTPEEGARTSLHLAASSEVEGVSGEYFVRCRAVKPSREARDPDAARRLWEESERLVARALA